MQSRHGIIYRKIAIVFRQNDVDYATILDMHEITP